MGTFGEAWKEGKGGRLLVSPFRLCMVAESHSALLCGRVLSGLLGPQFGWLEVETDALEVEKGSFPYPLSKGPKELVDLSSF